MFTPVTFPERFEPLVGTIEDTPPARIVDAIFHELHAGRATNELLLAGAFAAIRSSDVPPVHHGGPLHPVAGLHAVRNMVARLPDNWCRLPVIQSVAIANRHVHLLNCGPFILPELESAGKAVDVDAAMSELERCVRFGELHDADRYFAQLLEVLPRTEVLDFLLGVAAAKNRFDDHYLLYTTFTWRVIDSFGWDDAKILLRPVVRFVTRPPGPPDLERVDGLIDEHELLGRTLRVESGPDETSVVDGLSRDIGAVDDFNDITQLLAQALGGGLSLHGAGEALSLGASRLFLRSRTRDWMEVHANTTTNVQRFVIRQPQIGVRTKLRSLLVWDAGPDVRLLRRALASEGPEPARSASGHRSQESLLAEIDGVLRRIPPAGTARPPKGTRAGEDEIDHLIALAQQFEHCGHDAEALFTTLGKVVCRDESTEMHAYKHHQATYEEFHDTRASLRWIHLLAAVQGTALTRRGDDAIFRDAAERLHLG
jgi:hypothetical protein